MEEDTEYKKLSVEDQCVHKLWKARLHGYEECITIFREIDDEKSVQWNKYLGLIKKFVVDPHAMCQERGLEACLLFIENCAAATKIVGEVISGVVQKCMSSPKAKTKELAQQVALLFIEIEKQEIVIEELSEGMKHKNPKVVAACIATVTDALRKFGNKVIGIKPLIKLIPVLLSDRDKFVRTEGKSMTVELYRWIGDALKPHLSTLTPVLLTELEPEFQKVKALKPEPIRFLKSQMARPIEVHQTGGENENNEADNEVDDQNANIDPMDLIDPVDILSQLPKDFYDKLEEKKWQTRKEALESLETLLQNPKLMPGDYGDIVKALKKVLTKDSNVVLVAMAGKCLGGLAKGLQKKFSPYAQVSASAVFEKFKEKKPAVVAGLREAIDAIYVSTTLDTIQDDLLEALSNKNPSVKAETAMFLARAFSKTQPTVFNKKNLKVYCAALLKTLNESDPGVRDASAEALGMLMKLLGEKTVGLHLVDLDALKLAKIKECAEKAVVLVKVPTVKKVAAPPQQIAIKSSSADSRPTTAKVVKKTIASIGGKPVAKKQTMNSGGGGGVGGGGGAYGGTGKFSSVAVEGPDLSPEDVETRAIDIFSPNLLSELEDVNWKVRLSAVETFFNTIANLEAKKDLSQVLIRTVCKKPGLKDTHFQVTKIKLDIIKRCIELFGITTITAGYIMNDLIEKFGDIKTNVSAGLVLTQMADELSFDFVGTHVINYAFEQKSPKVQSESLLWLSSSLRDFGLEINTKNVIETLRKAVASTNPAVRQAGFSCLGLLLFFMGPSLMSHFDSEKPLIKQQIQTEFDKNVTSNPPAPTKGKSNKAATRAPSEDNLSSDENLDDMPMSKVTKSTTPKVDISGQITEALLTEIADKNWKTRNEALTKLQNILNDAKAIQANIGGDLPLSLSHRLVDSNAKIAQAALAICQRLAEVMGPPCKQHVRVLFPGFLNCLGDGKQFIRTASITCINTWGEQCGFKEFFEGEMIPEALKTGSPVLRSELWAWITEVLPNIPVKSITKDELVSCISHLYLNICDRSVDVRKTANEAVYGFMLHLGYETMVKLVEKAKPAQKRDILAALDKTRPNLPVKPLPKSKQQAPIEDSKPAKKLNSKLQKSDTNTKINQTNGGGTGATTTRKKEEDIDLSPMLAINNFKNQRLLDEQKLKVLKWTFTSPRDEFTDLLRDQMTAACVNKGLMANMFHDDFRYHLKAIETLIEDLSANSKALVCNLDLILKWISLRFYDTNPSVLLRGLEYLNLVFEMLCENEYVLAENESSCFIPHLLIKIGDPKDSVRNGVRSLLRQIVEVYPYTKVFVYIMDGLKSKNARQRTECLDELGHLIERYGMNVCQPTPASALKEIAKHISDRDNSVRNAALNCVVQAYFLVNDKVYKLIGNLNEKDLSMLDERIKRAKKNRKEPPPPQQQQQQQQTKRSSQSAVHGINDDEDGDGVMDEKEINENLTPPNEIESEPEVTYVSPIQPPIITARTGEFGLDPRVIAEIERDWVRCADLPKTQTPIFDLGFLNSPIKVAEINGVAYPADRLQQLMSGNFQQAAMAPPPSPYPRANYSNVSQFRPTDTVNSSFKPNLDPNLIRTIQAIGSSDSLRARAAINEIADILDSVEKQAVLRDYEELFVDSVCTQFKHLSQIPTSESLIMYQPVLSATYQFFTGVSLGKNIGIESLKKLMSILLGLMADCKLSNDDDGQYTKVINGTCLRILDRTNFSNLNCALIRLLKETCSGASIPKFTDLLMKCIWRNVKIMPDRSNELDYNAILYEIHEFMTTLPPAWWAQRPVDTPLRTVKTLIHNLVKLTGNDILQHFHKIPVQSELHTYLIRVLKNMQKENANSNTRSSARGASGDAPSTFDNKHISKQTHEQMSTIFKLIAGKDTSSDGIAKLYIFKKNHPDLDLTPFLKGASPVFQKFIEDSLADMEKSVGAPTTATTTTTTTTLNQNSNIFSADTTGHFQSKNKLDPDYWMDRLNHIKHRAHLNANDIKSNIYNNSNTVEHSNVNQAGLQSAPKKDRKENMSVNHLEAIQQKLYQIKLQNATEH